ncbi:hypothetical protein ACFWDQ_10580 [Streptomyces sp. NPDC060053]|uniref:hypothetical protein n=1 Tax=Streptomyces sp. NPDC060053 TaxID=3347047 RepID=UPI0036B7AC6B
MSAARDAARRFVRPGEVLSSVLEPSSRPGSALLWYALATLLYLENQAREPWDPELPDEGPVLLLACAACAAGVSLLLTRALRALPAGRTGRPAAPVGWAASSTGWPWPGGPRWP